MLRKAVLMGVLLSFFSSMNLAIASSKGELVEKFSEAQRLTTQGQVAQAITIYQTLILENPLLPEAYNNLAALYLQQNKIKEAKYILEQGLYADKGYGVLYESLTAINVAMAREAYSKALQIDLKPSVISIASLSLSSNKHEKKKNTIVISDEPKAVVKDKPVIKDNLISQPKVIVKTKPIIEVKRKNYIDSSKKNSQSIEKVLKAWSSAWSAQAIDVYLSFYHSKYKPTNGMSRKGWVQSRRYRLKKPHWIKVGLSNLKIRKQSKTQAVVNFKQSYQSNKFKDVSYKQVVLLNTNDGWQIYREKSF